MKILIDDFAMKIKKMNKKHYKKLRIKDILFF